MDTAIQLAEMAAGIGIAISCITLVLAAVWAWCKLTRRCRAHYDWPIGYEAGHKPGVKYTAVDHDSAQAPVKGTGLPRN